jgi:hypothetical protein
VESEPPGGGVALRGHEVAPVFRDEPEAEQQGGCGYQPGIDPVERRPQREHQQEPGAEMPLVNSCSEHVDPGTEPVPIDSQHAYIIRISAAGVRAIVAAFVTSRRASPFR